MVKETEMNFWKAEPLKDYKSVFSRFFFHLIWCSVGGTLTSLFSSYVLSSKNHFLFMAACVIGISTLGAVCDIWRLKRQNNGNIKSKIKENK